MIFLGFLLFIIVFLLIGNIAARHSKHTTEEYLIGGRLFGRYYVALSAGASAQSGFIMTGAVGMGYSLGLTSLYWPLGWLVGDLIFWHLFPHKVNKLARDTDSSTIPELLSSGNRVAPSVRTFTSLISIVFIGFYAASQFLASGKLIEGLFSVDLIHGIIITGIIVLAYCARGGVRSSIPTESTQAFAIFFTSIAMITYIISISPDFGTVVDTLNKADPALLDINGGRVTALSLLMFFGIAVYAFCFDMSQPHFLVRLVAGKSPDEVKKAKWLYIAFMQLIWISMASFGILLRVIMPDLSDPEQGLVMFAAEQFNPFIVGIILAGIFAAIASTLDALLLVLSSSLTVDLLPSFQKKLTSRGNSVFQIIGTVFVTICVIILTVFFPSSVFNLVIYSGIGLGSTYGPILLLKVLNINAGSAIVNTTMLAGLATVVLWRSNDMNRFVLDTLPAMLISVFVYLLLRKYLQDRTNPDQINS